MLNYVLIFLGAGFGGMLRYAVSNYTYQVVGKQFPYGTLVVNVSGCFLMGLLFVLLMEKFALISVQLRALLLIGFLGGYTTFSSFSIETLTLFENGAWLAGFMNIIGSLVLCLIAVWCGVFGGRQL